jgi:PKD repeat protein
MKVIKHLPISILFILLLFAHAAYAQDVYLSISGKKAPFDSGEDRHQYDFWVKPDGNASNGILQIYDAGLGGSVDLVRNNNATTNTTFSLYNFDDAYSYSSGSIKEKPSLPEPDITLITADEERFKNRWVPLSDLSDAQKEGYLIRVTATDGDDVNNFRFRMVSPNGEVLSGSSWHIIAIDLSIGVYRTSPNNSFQLRPFDVEAARNESLIVAGEEDTKVLKVDAFGNSYETSGNEIPAQIFDLPNNWGLSFTGSNENINNFTVFGADRPVLWLFEPIQTTGPVKPELDILESSTARCTDLAFELRSNIIPTKTLHAASWRLQDEEIAKGNQPTIRFSSRGTIKVNVLVPNQNSYFPEFWTYQKDIFVNTPPVARLSAPKEIISPAEPIVLTTEGSYDLEGQPLSYTWFVNGTPRGNGKTFEFSNTISGLYVISVRVSDGGAIQKCSNTQKQIRIRVNTQPYAEIALTEVFGIDEEVQFNVVNQSDADNDRLYYEWNGAGINERTFGDTISVSHAIPGIYAITLTANDSSKATNASYTVTRQYEVNAAPVVSFNSPEKVAPGDEIILDATATTDQNDSTLHYTWFVDNEKIEGGSVANLVLNAPKTYDIRLQVDDGRGVSNSVQSLTKSLRVNDAPQPVIIAPEITSSSLVNIKAEGAEQITRYQWDFGDGHSGTGQDTVHVFQKPGTYTLKLTVDDGEGLANSIQTAEHILVVNKFPTAAFEAPLVVAPAEPFTPDGSLSLDEDGMIESYSWYLDGVPAGTGEQPSLVLAHPGQHTLSLEVKDNSGFDIARGLTSKPIRVNKAPVAKWTTSPLQPIPNTEIIFSAADSYDPDGEIAEYIWTFEDGTELKGAEVTHTFQESGAKNFTLTVTDSDRLSNSTTTIDGTINLNHQPYIVTEPAIRSNSLDITLDASQSYDLDEDPISFEWTLPDGSKRYESSFSWKAPETGVHIISLQVNDGLGLANSGNEELIRVLINRPVKAVVDSMIASCTGQTVLFNSSRSYDPDGDAFQVKWDFGDGKTSEQANPSYSYEKPGVYQAKLTMNDGFTDEATVANIPVIIEGSPIARMNIADTTICVNSSLVFDGSASSDPSGSRPSFAWDLGDGNAETGAKVTHVFTEPGEYIVSLTVEGSGSGLCSNISQVTGKVRVIEGPVANFELPEWTAPGEAVSLDGSASAADGGFKKAEWLIENVQSTESENGLKTEHIFNQPGEYFVTLNLETNTTTSCNTVSLTKTIKVNAAPEIVWNLPTHIPAGSDLKLDAGPSKDADGYIKTYRWYLDGTLISQNVSEIIKAIKPGKHTVRLEITDNSSASNNSVAMEKTFFANSAPKPIIEVAKQRFLHEKVQMASLSATDQDGDQLSTAWYLDGNPVSEPVFTPNEQRTHRLVLVQDDGRGLSNSVDSAVVEYIPKKLPVANPELPDLLAEGAQLTIAQIHLSDQWKFMESTAFSDTWTANSPQKDSLTVAWLNDGQALTKTTFKLQVVEKLAFVNQPDTVNLKWNPANPSAIIKAPLVNREPASVKYIWQQQGKTLGEGIQQELPLTAGENRFTVQVTDLQVEQSKPITVELIVITD